MVDIETYKKLHPKSTLARLNLQSNIGSKEMMSDVPPSGDAILVFPPIIPGYNLLRKTWGRSSARYIDAGIC